MRREALEAAVTGGTLGGWVQGDGPRVLLLHGGPGLSYGYLDDVAADIGEGRRVAAYQQRGVEPSTDAGPYDVATAVADVAAVLDALAWPTATVVGHSWGGHLAMHVAVALPDRLDGVLCLDPLGGVGDGGEAEFEAAMAARTPDADRARARELDERAMRGEGTEADAVESLRLFWPAYFPDAAAAPPMPDIRLSLAAYAGLYESLLAELPRLEAALPSVRVPFAALAGAGSPMPVSASADVVERVPGAWLEVVGDAGHFPWLDRPGCVRAALDRLAT